MTIRNVALLASNINIEFYLLLRVVHYFVYWVAYLTCTSVHNGTWNHRSWKNIYIFTSYNCFKLRTSLLFYQSSVQIKNLLNLSKEKVWKKSSNISNIHRCKALKLLIFIQRRFTAEVSTITSISCCFSQHLEKEIILKSVFKTMITFLAVNKERFTPYLRCKGSARNWVLIQICKTMRATTIGLQILISPSSSTLRPNRAMGENRRLTHRKQL